jgi:hypothetical protein
MQRVLDMCGARSQTEANTVRRFYTGAQITVLLSLGIAPIHNLTGH